ncbi:hypothetical protein O0L34_g10584 [Tuta absoluta]|nr:hypothetical protein O0L34_g10584 [Tuta absoluta]
MRPLDNKPKDRGDHTRKVVKIAKNLAPKDTQIKPETKIFYDLQNNHVEDKHDYLFNVENEAHVDRGDAEKIQQQKKVIEDKKSYKLKNTRNMQLNQYGSVRLPEKILKKIYDKMAKVVEPLDIEKRRRLYHMYTFRKPSEDIANNYTKKDDSTETELPVKSCQTIHHSLTERVHSELPTPHSVKPPSAPRIQKTSPKTRIISPARYKRKPIIKTITAREGDSKRIYKSVSFVQQQSKVPLKIHTAPKTVRAARTRSPLRTGKNKHSSPHSQKSKHSDPSHTDTICTDATSKVAHRNSLSSVQKLVMNRGCKSKRRRIRYCSPEDTVAPPPPVTEMAKWAPQSVNDHTKHYYEAWVNTTLAAISSDSEKMRREKELIVKQMQMKLEYQAAMEKYDDDFSDEKYTGRIVIRR